MEQTSQFLIFLFEWSISSINSGIEHLLNQQATGQVSASYEKEAFLLKLSRVAELIKTHLYLVGNTSVQSSYG